MTRLSDWIVYGSVPVIGYGIIQSTGYDFVHWQVNSSVRIWSSFGNPNFFAGYLVMILPLIVSLIMRTRALKKLALIAVLLGGLYCLVFTYSRSGCVGIVVAGFVYMLLVANSRMRKYLLSLASILLLLLIAVVAISIAGRDSAVESIHPQTGWFSTVGNVLSTRIDVNDPNVKARVDYMKVAVKMFKLRPLTGFGPDTFSILWRKYMPADVTMFTTNRLANPGYAHSELLQVLATGGLVGACGYLYVLVRMFTVGLSTVKVSAENKYRTAALVSSLAGIVAANQFSFHSPVTATYLWFLGGYSAVVAGTTEKRYVVPEKARELGSAVLLAVIFFCLVFTMRTYVAEQSFPRGLYFESKHMFDTAIRYYKTAISNNPYEQTYYQNLGKIYIARASEEANKENKIKFLEFSVKSYHKHVTLVPQDALSWNGLGIAQMNLAEVTGQSAYYRDAERSFRAAIGQAPQFLEPYINLGSQLYMTGKKQEAVSVYKEALEIDSREPLIYFNMGNMYAQEGDMNRAKSYWQDALDLNPNFEQAKLNIEANSIKK
jgi:O-antigen ligase/Flp pilus assembly protein TadD